jgi:hypothetical protein
MCRRIAIRGTRDQRIRGLEWQIHVDLDCGQRRDAIRRGQSGVPKKSVEYDVTGKRCRGSQMWHNASRLAFGSTNASMSIRVRDYRRRGATVN